MSRENLFQHGLIAARKRNALIRLRTTAIAPLPRHSCWCVSHSCSRRRRIDSIAPPSKNVLSVHHQYQRIGRSSKREDHLLKSFNLLIGKRIVQSLKGDEPNSGYTTQTHYVFCGRFAHKNAA